jgi:hypothetical protein
MDASLGVDLLPIPKTWGFPIEVTVVGYHVCYTNVPYFSWDLDKYRLRDNIFGAVARDNQVSFPQRHIFGKLFPKAFILQAYLATPLRVIPSSYFGDPEGILWGLH